MGFSEVLTIILIVLKLIGILEIGWIACFSPIIIEFVFWVIVAIIANK